MAYNFVQLNCN